MNRFPGLALLIHGAVSADTSTLTGAGGATPSANSARLLDVDISDHWLKFSQCRSVNTYDGELAQDSHSSTVLATKNFVVFRLCPEYGNDCKGCNSNYGEYLVDLESYLDMTVDYVFSKESEMCSLCKDGCQNNYNHHEENNTGNSNLGETTASLSQRSYDSCNSCYDECQKLQSMEENGFIDATEFSRCVMIYDPEDDGPLYAGPLCEAGGTKIKIGVFTDEYCNFHDPTKNVEDYLINGDGYQLKLSHFRLKKTYQNTCISCLDSEAQDVAVCKKLYEVAAKCEVTHGFRDGIFYSKGYRNQAAQEELTCDFIEGITSGSYNEMGDVILRGQSIQGAAKTSITPVQVYILSFLLLGVVLTSVSAVVLQRMVLREEKKKAAALKKLPTVHARQEKGNSTRKNDQSSPIISPQEDAEQHLPLIGSAVTETKLSSHGDRSCLQESSVQSKQEALQDKKKEQQSDEVMDPDSNRLKSYESRQDGNGS